MAKKKSTTTAAKTTKTTVKQTTAKKATTAKATKPKATTTAASTKTSAAPKKATAKKAPVVKLSDKQREVLSKIASAGTGGYNVELKPEQRTVDSLKEKKLVKTGAKDKATGKVPYHVTKAGEKALATTSAGATS